jgi:hypothetical protein
MAFVKATRTQAKGRAAFIGVTGGGKTYAALMWAAVLAGPGGRIAVGDTENASASKYAGRFAFDKDGDLFDCEMQPSRKAESLVEFDVDVMRSFTPQAYIDVIHAAEDGGYAVTILDSLSHAWAGKDGVLALVDEATKRANAKSAFTSGWRDVTPQHNALVDALVQCQTDLFVTMRVKQEFVIEEVNGKKAPRKVGMAPIQRDGVEYEFDLVCDLNADNEMIVSKTRCSVLSKKVFAPCKPEHAEIFKAWLRAGAVPIDTRVEAIKRLKDAIEKYAVPTETVDKVLAWAKSDSLDNLTEPYAVKAIERIEATAAAKQSETAAA